jgi:SOS-response transcriptional repressor LexA
MNVRHHGNWLRARIERLGKSKAAFARRAGMSPEHLSRLFNEPTLIMRPDAAWRIIDALGLSSAMRGRAFPDRDWQSKGELDITNYLSKSLFDELIALDRSGHLPPALSIAADVDRNVEQLREFKVVPVPTFELSIAAGGWTDIDGVAEVCDPALIDQGHFRIRIRGESMRPRYKDRSLIEFRWLHVDRERFIEGRDYFVQREHDATFKRVEKRHELAITLRALNKRKYPRPLLVPLEDVQRAALAVALVELIE